LEEKKHGEMLMSRGILYAPDYAINAGGLINVCHELMGYNKDKAISQTLGIYNTLLSVFESSEREKIPTWEATNKIAESRIEAARKTTPRLSNTFNNQSWIHRS
jgi:leucine dehydrogenase